MVETLKITWYNNVHTYRTIIKYYMKKNNVDYNFVNIRYMF